MSRKHKNDTVVTTENDTVVTTENDTVVTTENDTVVTTENDTVVTTENDTDVTPENDTPDDKGAFEMSQANGQSYHFDVTLDFQPSTQKGKQEAIMLKTAEMIHAYNGVTKGYFTMVSSLAVMIGNNYFKEIKGIKTPNEFLTKVIGVSKSHASEMTKVAKTFYTSLGKLKNEELGLFNYTELVLLANKDESIIEDVITAIKATEKHTRADVVNAIESATQKALGVETTDEEVDEEVQESNNATSDNSGSATNNNESTTVITINYKKVIETFMHDLLVIQSRIADVAEENMENKELANIVNEINTLIFNINAECDMVENSEPVNK